MPRNVVITPLSGLVDFYDLNSNLDAKIQIDDPGNLSITNSGGTLTLGNTAANVVIGDGVNNVDMIFEQNGAIRGATGRTLTLGSSASNITIQSPLTINSTILNTTNDGFFEIRQTNSTWTNSTSHPIIKWNWNATYDDHLYLASGGNAGGTTQSALIIGETTISFGKANATPNSSSVLSIASVTIGASTGNITSIGSIGSAGTGYRALLATDAGGNLNLGRIDNVASLPYIDFNCGATTVDHDVRLQAGGGNGTNGGGTLTLTGNLSVSGNLIINGTTTTVNSTTVTIDDPIFTLGGDTAPTSDDNKDRGIEFRWHNGTVAKVGFFGYDDSTGKFTFIPDTTNTSEVFSGTKGTIDANLEWADVLSKPNYVASVATTAPLSGGAVGSVGGALTLSLASGYGDTQNPYASKTANTFLAAPNGSTGVPTFRALVAADIPTLNQNTTGTAANVTGTVAVANGGTGATAAPAARTNLGATTVGSNLFTLTSPSAITFIRVNADNTVSAMDAATFRTAIGAGTVTLTGTETLTNKTLTGARETRIAIPASDINLLAGNYFSSTISGATTLTVSNVPASGTSSSFILDLTNGGSAVINWWSGVKWAGGTAPTLTASGRDVLGFFTHDGGTTWTGLLLGKDVK